MTSHSQPARVLAAVGLLATVVLGSRPFAQSPSTPARPSAAGRQTTTAPAPAKPWKLGRTAWGHPDLQGMWTNFDGSPFEKAPEGSTNPREGGSARYGPGSDLGDAEFYKDWGNSPISPLRPSLVIDPPTGRVPVRPEAEKLRDYHLARYADSWEHQSSWERCITRGPGNMFPTAYNNARQIVQTPEYVVINQEMIHEVRIIPIDGRPYLSPVFKFWMGDSRGHWEGDTLVVETTHFNDKGVIQTSGRTRIKGIGVSEELRLTERFTRVSENLMNYEVTINDPKNYTAPWKVGMPLNLDPGYRMIEYACHEGNQEMPHALSTGRAIDREKEAAAAGTKK